jgi:hypothetical protein
MARPLHLPGGLQGNRMLTTDMASTELLRNRNKTVAKSFYRQLKTEGFSHDQIIELSVALLDLVNQELVNEEPTAQRDQSA